MKLPKGVQTRGNSYVAYVSSPTGKPVRKVIGVVGCHTRAELVQRRAELEKQVRDGLYPAPSIPSAQLTPVGTVIMCTDLWEAYKRDCRNRGVRRIDRLEFAWSHLEPTFGSKPAADVKPKEIADYMTSRSEAGMANATCNREIAILKAAFRHGARLELIERIPAFPRKLKEAKPRAGFVEEGQYKTLMSNAREPWLRCFVGLGFNFGMRKGELLALRCRGMLTCLKDDSKSRTAKNGEGRKVALTEETKTLLTERIRGKQPNDYVLARADGSRVAQPRKDWYAVCCRSGLGKKLVEEHADGKTSTHHEGLQMHDLQRSAVRRMIRRGVAEKVAMMISGHKTRCVFDRYHITNEPDLEQAAKFLEPSAQPAVSGVQNRHKTITPGFVHS